MNDQTILAAGRVYSRKADSTWVTKLTAQGEILWIKTFLLDENEEDPPDITSIVIALDKGLKKDNVIELDVSFQTGNIINVIISSKEHVRIKNLKVGFKIDDIQFFSPIAMFKGSGIVSNITNISSGPKNGDYSLEIKLVDL